jgi:hypothetical protein
MPLIPRAAAPLSKTRPATILSVGRRAYVNCRGRVSLALDDGRNSPNSLADGADHCRLCRAPVGVAVAGAVAATPGPGADGNPFSANPLCNVDGSGIENCPEIYALGFRNPWRWSFDRQAGDLWVGDVGQNSFEEIDIVERNGNYGWNSREGGHCFEPATGCATAGLTDPVAEYDRSLGFSITGGYVYRGQQTTLIAGRYVFGDFGGMIASLAPNDAGGFDVEQLVEQGCTPPEAQGALQISSFAEDLDGELFVIDYGRGQIRELEFTD